MPKLNPKSKKQQKQRDDSDIEQDNSSNSDNSELTNVYIANMDFHLTELMKDVKTGYETIELKYNRVVNEFLNDFNKRSRSASIMSVDECISNSPTSPPQPIEFNKLPKNNKISPSM
jgi:hypothetical protein